MKSAFSDGLLKYTNQENFVFLTGDLGFNMLELLRDAMGERFVNAGVAEQNMISVAAGLASQGFRPWVYSIGPFLYARPLEQIRNDICLQDKPVVLVGNGGGYHYGSMGPTHHSLEDYGVLSTLPNMKIFIPAFNEDIVPMITNIWEESPCPIYFRLGRPETPEKFYIKQEEYSQWRNVLPGENGKVLLITGPIIGSYLEKYHLLSINERPSIWCLSEIPIIEDKIPIHFINEIKNKSFSVIEEHTSEGSVAQKILYSLARMGHFPKNFEHQFAKGYHSKKYGSQKFHRDQDGLSCH